MLSELHIQNFAVIKDIHLKLEEGLTILSGEEGAGKSLMVDALTMLIGARTNTALVRSRTASARVEGVFWLTPETTECLHEQFKESDIEPESDGMLIISREIQQQGRSVARINGRVVPLSLLRNIGKHLIDIHGQTDTLSILDVHRQLEVLDAHGGLNKERLLFSQKLAELRQAESELCALNADKRDGRQDLLRFQADEIDNAAITGNEDLQLQERRDALMNAEVLQASCMAAYSCLYSDDKSATVLIHEALISLKGLRYDTALLSASRGKLEEAISTLEDTARDLRNYSETIEADAEQLEQIDQRLHLLNTLKRKYGGSLEAVLAFYYNAISELQEIENRTEHIKACEKKVEQLKSEAGRMAEELSLNRRRAAKSLTVLINSEMADLGLPHARFDIALKRELDTNGIPSAGGKYFSCSVNGIDQVEFMAGTNPGEPMRSLSSIASGGETCRIMLALKSALNKVDPIPLLVFDEIDGGVGGRSGDIMGKKLALLAAEHQVLCITHLPQIACFGDRHIKLIKDTSGGKAVTIIQPIEGDSRIEELAAMLGSKQAGQPMVDGADRLLSSARVWKEQSRVAVAA